MKLPAARCDRGDPKRPFGRLAFTFTEMMITMAVFCLVMAGVIASHLYGLRMWQITSPKLGASDDARAAISRLFSDIRSARLIRIGNGSVSTFTEVGINAAQKGSAIQVYPTLDTNFYIRYFWDANDHRLKLTTNGSSSVVVLANSISNTLVFTAEDYSGNILTNNYNNRVIGLLLEFYQIEYPSTAVGAGNYYDYYRLRTRIARRTIL